jgi:hypothetical protein
MQVMLVAGYQWFEIHDTAVQSLHKIIAELKAGDISALLPPAVQRAAQCWSCMS